MFKIREKYLKSNKKWEFFQWNLPNFSNFAPASPIGAAGFFIPKICAEKLVAF
jgi:hypothetical protein